MSIRIVVSDAISRRVAGFPAERFAAFQRMVADVAKGRACGKLVHASAHTRRRIFLLQREGYSLYYSLAPDADTGLVFEEFLTAGEEELVLDLFAEGAD